VTTFPVPPAQQLATMLARNNRRLNVTSQQAVLLKSGLSAATPQAWTPFELLNGWNSITGFIPAQYRQFAAGCIEIIGVIGGGSIANGTVIAALPAGSYNSAHAWLFPVVVVAGATASPDDTPMITADVTGALEVSGLPAGTNQLAFHEFLPLT
jgi:hypothetical protein